ncbi:MAG: methyl-accepting chemotaxis protein [Sphaerochaetaceae bacterium]|nr:methyl-accepting chemotaxis protein [Sphaerochaetaceae bacterium]
MSINTSIGKKFSIINLSVTVIVVLGSFLVLNYYKNQVEKEVLLSTQNNLKSLLDDRINAKKAVGISNAVSIANDGRIKKAIRTDDRKWAILTLGFIHNKMKESTPFKNIKVHVHAKDNKSFVRAWKPEKYGDDLSGFRHSVVKVNKTQKAVNTFEVGKAGLSLRSVVPVSDDNGTHLGSLEFIQGLNSVAKDFDKNKDAFLLLMDTSKSDVKQFDKKSIFKEKYLISQKFVNKKFLDNAKNIDMDFLINNGYYESESFFFTYEYVKDFQSQNIGLYLIARPSHIVNQAIHDAEIIINISMFVLILLAIILTLTTQLNLKKTVLNPIQNLSKAVDSLIKFNSSDQKIDISSNDEIGQLAKNFNSYLNRLRETVKKDQVVVQEAERAIQMVRSGFFIYTVNADTDNKSTNDLKNSINGMIKDLNEKFLAINNALIEYGNANFDYEFEMKDVSGTVGSIAFATKAIGNNVSELMATIMLSGEQLSSNIEVLSSSANSLSRSANEQAASLEETAAAVEEISSNIQNSSQNVAQMSEVADELTKSSNTGQELASKTALSMDDINVQVTAIKEAISVIDQIAFQTNILSLNAAVEAATAGEAGKGFAVVAGEVRNLASRSAEAASEIKTLVENATSKANEGKKIADDMINGYAGLKEKIAQTKNMIDSVAMSSTEQSKGIAQINDAITILDKNTQENASDATNIDTLAIEVKKLSDSLIDIANHAKYKQSAREQVCDTQMVYKLNSLKLDHINFKNINFLRLDERKSFKVATHNDCKLGKWMKECEEAGYKFTQSANWNKLHEYHDKVHSGVQSYIDKSANHDSNEQLLVIANDIEHSTDEVFKSLDILKVENCKTREN